VEFTFAFDDTGDQVTTTLTGTPTPADFERLADELEADPRFHRYMLHLVDCSQLEVIDDEEILFEQMEPLAERDWEFPPRRRDRRAGPDVRARGPRAGASRRLAAQPSRVRRHGGGAGVAVTTGLAQRKGGRFRGPLSFLVTGGSAAAGARAPVVGEQVTRRLDAVWQRMKLG
jgi:hypothetical protein